jgi:hypothetical protein
MHGTVRGRSLEILNVEVGGAGNLFVFPFYLQSVPVHSANCVKYSGM